MQKLVINNNSKCCSLHAASRRSTNSMRQLLLPCSTPAAVCIHSFKCVCATGPNFQFYPTPANNHQQQQQQLSITGLEPNPAMWRYTQQAAAAARLGQQQLQLVAADAQQMPFERNSFDAAVVTLVGGCVLTAVLPGCCHVWCCHCTVSSSVVASSLMPHYACTSNL
jgi:hypothetical protein